MANPTLGAILTYDNEAAGWYPPSPYAHTETSVRIIYASNGLPSGYADKLFVNDADFDAPAEATLALTNTNGSATYLDVTGLSPDRSYIVRVFRYDGSDALTSEFSNRELIYTSHAAVQTTVPANYDKTFDWATDDLNAALTRGWYNTWKRETDAEMGTYLRIVDPGYLWNNETEGGYWTQNPWNVNGVSRVSPNYDWTIEYDARLGSAIGTNQRFRAGLFSNNPFMLAVNLQTYQVHSAGSNIWCSSIQQSSWANWHDQTVFASAYPPTTPSGAALYPSGGWLPFPRTTDPDYATRQVAPSTKFTWKMAYTASAKELKLYFNNYLIMTLGPDHDPANRKVRKYPANNHYPFGISAMLGCDLDSYQAYYGFQYPADSQIDLGRVRIYSACPRSYYSWHIDEQALWGQGSTLVHTHPQFAVWQWHDSGWWPNVNLFTGYTSPVVSGGVSGYPAIPDETVGSSTVFSTALTTGRIATVVVPEGSQSMYVRLLGWKQYGTMVGRVLDQDDAQIGDDIVIDGVFGVEPTLLPTGSATQIKIEVSIQYDGSAIDFGTPYVTDVAARRPNTPSIFTGFDVEFGLSTSPPSSIHGGTITGGSMR